MIKKNVGHCEIDVIKVDKNIYYNKRQLDNGFGVVNNIEIYKFNNNKLKDTEYISIWDLNRYYTPTEYELDTIYFFFYNGEEYTEDLRWEEDTTINNLKKQLKDKMIEPISSESEKWDDEVVYHIYRNDDLETLPVGILEQMANHIQHVIKNKTNK